MQINQDLDFTVYLKVYHIYHFQVLRASQVVVETMCGKFQNHITNCGSKCLILTLTRTQILLVEKTEFFT